MVELDCPICLEAYDDDAHSPVKLFCCSKTLCLFCLENIASNTSACPWDKKRWIQRSVIKKCLQNTPNNYLRLIQSLYSSQDHSQSNHMPTPHLLGDGSLKADYDSLLKVRHAEDSAQIEKDDQLAYQLLQEEEERFRSTQEKREAMLAEDTRIAADLAQRLREEAGAHGGTVQPQKQRVGLTQGQGRGSIRESKLKSRKSIGGSTSTGSRNSREEKMPPQKIGILHYFNNNSSARNKNGESSGSSSCSTDSPKGNIGESSTSGKKKRQVSKDTSSSSLSSSSSSSSLSLPVAKKRQFDPHLDSSSQATPDSASTSSSQSSFKLQHSADDTFTPSSFVEAIDITSPPHQQSLAFACTSSPTQQVELSQPSASPAAASWICAVCTFSNYGLLAECEMCGEKKSAMTRLRASES